MDERRDFFRIRNKGEIHAHVEGREVCIRDLSARGAAINADVDLPQHGSLALKINLFTLNISYELLKIDPEETILIFTNENQITKLLPVLKNLRKEAE